MDEDEYGYAEESQEPSENSGSNLRKQLESTLKENRALKRDRDYLQAEKLVATVASSLEQAGFIGQQAKFVPVDVAADPARLNGWIEENQSLLARNGGAVGEPDGEPEAPGLGAERADGIRKMQSLNAGGQSATVDLDALHQRMLDPSLSETDFDNLLEQYR